ncbi:MAG: hypothetical protein M3Y87_16065 [Myxococcota bacterium]|nr:hypothetical protein [Myxococcota bacterium]
MLEGVTRSREMSVVDWNLEIDRLETLPSGLEFVFAGSADDVSAAAIDGWLQATLADAGICRTATPPPFNLDSVVSGILEPRPGVVVSP